jgi:hypothetical protein
VSVSLEGEDGMSETARPDRPSRTRVTSKTTVPYLVGALAAAAVMAWYFFVYVPNKLEYFIGLRFRTLAVASGQVKSKGEKLADSLQWLMKSTAPRTVSSSASQTAAPTPKANDALAPEYLVRLLPDLVTSKSTDGRPFGVGLHLIARSAGPRTGLNASCTDAEAGSCTEAYVSWDNVVRAARAVSLRDFEDLLLADEKGVVVWQREEATPRVGRLDELVVSESEPNPWFSLNWDVHTSIPKTKDPAPLPDTAFLKPVDLSGVPTYLLIQAVTLKHEAIANDREQKVYVVGVISRQANEQQAMRIPVVWIVYFLVPLVLLFLALPFVKLATLTPKERYGAADVVLLATAAVCAFGIGAVLPFGTAAVDRRGDPTLKEIAARIEQHFALETKQVLDFATAADESRSVLGPKAHAACRAASTEQDGCNLWQVIAGRQTTAAQAGSTPFLPSVVPGQLELDVVAWVNRATGDQTEKWSTKREVTVRVTHRSYAHYAALVAQHVWSLKSDPESRQFTIEPLRTPTTAEMGTIFGLYSKNAGEFLAINVRPASLVDPLLPPGYGFAIIAPDGRVVFHSEESFSLLEDFFAEVSDTDGVRHKAESSDDWAWSGDYHGRPHRFFMRPMAEFVSCPWRLITFQELDSGYAVQLRQQSGILRLGALNLAVVVLVSSLFWVYSRSRRRNGPDLFLSSGIVSNTALGALTILALAAVVILFATYFQVIDRYLNAVYVFMVILPVVALGIAVGGREAEPLIVLPERVNKWPPVRAVVGLCKWLGKRVKAWADARSFFTVENNTLAMELVLVNFLVALAPAIVFTRLVYRVEDVKQTELWLERVSADWVARQGRVRDRAVGTRVYTPETAALLTSGAGFAASSSDWLKLAHAAKPDGKIVDDPPFSYLQALSRVHLEIQPNEAEPTTEIARGQELVRALTEIGAATAMLRHHEPHVAAARTDARFVLGHADNVDSPVFSVASLGSLDGFDWDSAAAYRTLFGLLIVGCTFAAVVWARGRLRLIPFVRTPSLQDQVNAASTNGRDAILVIGPPRIGKDQAVRCALRTVKSPEPTAPANDGEASPATHPVSEQTESLDLIGIRLPLLDVTLDGATVDELVHKVDSMIAQGNDSRLDCKGRLWIHISNLEMQLVSPAARKSVVHLLDRLLDGLQNTMPRVLIVTTSVDPIANFEDVFSEERQTTYDDPTPEVELSRSSMMLSRFRRCFLPISNEGAAERWTSWLSYDEKKWEDTLDREVAGYAPLVTIAAELRSVLPPKKRLPREELVRVIGTRAEAAYQLLWTSCTRSEKLVLVQLAQEGLINPKSRSVAGRLMAKGLVANCPGPTVFNYTFREFLRGIERHQVVNQWEQMEGSGLWVMAGRLIGSSLVAGGVFFLLTQDFSVQTLMPILSGTGVLGVPIVRDLLARITGKSTGTPT